MTTEEHLIHHLMGSYYAGIVPNYYIGYWECDVFSLNKSGYTAEYEIKLSKQDYLKDFGKAIRRWRSDNKIFKHDLIKTGQRTNRFWFVCPEDLDVEIPKYAGLMTFVKSQYWDRLDFTIKKKAPLLKKEKADDKTKLQIITRLTVKHYQKILKIEELELCQRKSTVGTVNLSIPNSESY
jgi:hypothetical protein